MTRQPQCMWTDFPRRGMDSRGMRDFRVLVVTGDDWWTDYYANLATHNLFAHLRTLAPALLYGREGTFDLDPAHLVFAQRYTAAAEARFHAMVAAYLATPPPPDGGLHVAV